MRYPGCQKEKAFRLFDKGKRPSEIYDLVDVKKHTLFYYYQLWKKEHLKAELERCWKRRLQGCENEIQHIKRYPKIHRKGELAKWQAQKAIAIRRLKNLLSTTDEEKSHFRRYHSFKF